MKKKLLKGALILSTLFCAVQLDAQFTEDFEAAGIPAGWLVLDEASANTWEFTAPADGIANSGTQVARIDFSTNAHDDYLITPQISVVDNSTDRLTVFGKNRSDFFVEEFNILISTTGTAAADFTVLLDGPLAPPLTWEEYTYDLSAYEGQDIYIAFQAISTNEFSLYLDDVTIDGMPTCPEPSALVSSNVTNSSFDVDWTENGSATLWNIEVGTQGFTPGSGNEVFADIGNTTQTSNATGLSGNITYDVYVKADCGGGDESPWVGPLTLTTPPDPQTPVSSFPWDEDFETGATEWTLLNGSQTNQWHVGTAINNGGANSLYISDDAGTSHNYDNGASTTVFAYRDVTFPATVAEATITFDWLCDGESNFSSWDFLNVFAVPTTTTLTLGTELTPSGTAPTGIIDISGVIGEETTFQTSTFSIPAAYAGETFRIVFQWENDGGGGQNPPIAVDNVNISIFSCLAPSGLVATDVTTDGATVSWDDNTSGAPSFEVEYGPVGFTPGTGTTVVVTDTFAVLTGLMQDQDYEYYVSAECGDGTFSQQSSVGTFTTLIACDAVSNVSVVDVTATTVELTWSAPVGYTDFIIEYGPAGFTPGSGTQVTAPPLVVTGLDDDTEYDFYVYSDCGGGSLSQPEGPVNVTTPPSCPAPTDIVFSEIGADSVVVEWTENGSATDWVIEYDTAGFTIGTGTQVLTTDNPDTLLGLNPEWTYDVYVWADCGAGDLSDTISGSFTTQPTCIAPSNLVFSEEGADSVVVEWTYNGSATDWVIEYDTAGFVPGTGTQVTTTDNPDTLLGLNPEWTYDVYVWADCGAGELSDTISGSFTTQPSCLPVSGISVTDISTDTAVVSWTVGGSETEWDIEYGPTGFTPGNGTVISNITNNPYNLTGLDQNTDYDIYVYANCGGGDLSDPEGPESFTTDPTCPPISDIVLDSVSLDYAELSWTNGGSETSWNIEYDTTGFTLGNGTVEVAGTNPYALTGLESNYSYDVYITADCGGGDLADTIGAFTFITDPSCGDTIYDNGGSTGDYASNTDDVVTIRSTAPNQYVRVTFEEFDYESSFDGMYVYDGEDLNAPLIPSANGAGFGSVTDPGAYWGAVIPGPFTGEVLTFNFVSDGLFENPGHKAFVDCFDCDPTPGVDGSVDFCRLDDTLDLNTLVTIPSHPDASNGGQWMFPSNPGALVQDSLIVATSLAEGTYEAMYILNTPCGGDTTVATINIYGPSQAGSNGTLTVCLNEPINLYDGLSGTADIGGDWYDPSNNLLPNSQPTASNIPGSFNYDYITSNGVCPADTALVEVIVDGGCDWLSIGEEELNEISVYPNPATNVINIVNPANTSALKVEIFDVNGRVVASDNKALENSTEGSIAIDHLETGIYTLRIYGENGHRTFKIVKK